MIKKWKYFTRLISLGVFLATFLYSACFAEGVYRCQSEHGVIFQDTPCLGHAKQDILDSHRYPPTIPSNTQTPASGTSRAVTPSSAKSSMQKTGGQGQIIIERSRDSHFYIDCFINNIPVRFLVDTGASLVAIPDNLMSEMGLVNEQSVKVRAATGIVHAYKTTIKELRIENYTFNNVAAQTMPGSQALLGMNVLSMFDVSLKDDQLILSNKDD